MSAVYENDHFVVKVKPEFDGYVVCNKETNVAEFEDKQISNAISYAEHGHSFLKNKLWRMIGVQGEQTAEFLNKQGPTAALDDAIDGL